MVNDMAENNMKQYITFTRQELEDLLSGKEVQSTCSEISCMSITTVCSLEKEQSTITHYLELMSQGLITMIEFLEIIGWPKDNIVEKCKEIDKQSDSFRNSIYNMWGIKIPENSDHSLKSNKNTPNMIRAEYGLPPVDKSKSSRKRSVDGKKPTMAIYDEFCNVNDKHEPLPDPGAELTYVHSTCRVSDLSFIDFINLITGRELNDFQKEMVIYYEKEYRRNQCNGTI